MKTFASSQTNPGTIRPFRLETTQAELQDLKQRLSMTRWPDELPGLAGITVHRSRL